MRFCLANSLNNHLGPGGDSWESFSVFLKAKRPPYHALSEEEKAPLDLEECKLAQEGFIPGLPREGAPRGQDAMLECWAVVLDFDNHYEDSLDVEEDGFHRTVKVKLRLPEGEYARFDAVKELIQKRGIRAAMYSSFRSGLTDPNGAVIEKFRVVIPFTEPLCGTPVDPDQWGCCNEWVIQFLGLNAFRRAIDPAPQSNPACLFYLPCGWFHEPRLEFLEGTVLSIPEDLVSFAPPSVRSEATISRGQGCHDLSFKDSYHCPDGRPINWATFDVVGLLKSRGLKGRRVTSKDGIYNFECPFRHSKPSIHQAYVCIHDHSPPTLNCRGVHGDGILGDLCNLVGPDVVAQYAEPMVSTLDGVDLSELTFGSAPMATHVPLPLMPRVTIECVDSQSDFSIENLVVSGSIPPVATIQRRYAEDAGNMAVIQRKKVSKTERDPGTGEENEVDEYQVHLVRMCDFVATISQENLVHEGDEAHTEYWIEAVTAGGKHLPTLKVKAADFPTMKWLDLWGADISIAQGWHRSLGSVNGNIKEAIVERKKVFPPSHCEVWDHLGWREINGAMTYLHAKGGITSEGLVPDLTVDTKQPSLKNYGFESIPEGGELRHAIRSSLRILDLGRDAETPTGGDVATVPVYLAAFRSTLPIIPKWGCHAHAGTGQGKSTLVALLQGHFDTKAEDTTLAGSWLSTASALETLVHAAKNCVVPIDDASQSVDKIDQKMDRIFRSSGNGTSRQRMRSTMEAMRSFPPRAMVLSTGEDLPPGHSCRARVMLISTPAIVHPQGDNSLLDKLQQDVRDGVMTGAMAAWLQWLAPQVKEIEKDWNKILIGQRKSMDLQLIQQHGRSVDQVAELLITGRLVLSWAVAQEAITQEESNAYMARFMTAFIALSEDQQVEQSAENPVTKFFNLLPDLMASGHCHLLDADSSDLSGAPMTRMNEFGWSYSGAGDFGGWKPRGICVGKLKGNQIYLNPTAAHSVVVEYAKRSGASFAITGQMFWKSMKPFLVKGDGRNLGKKMSSKMAEGMESSHAPCVLVTAFPQWEAFTIPTTRVALGERRGGGMGKSGGQFEVIQPIPNFSAFPVVG